MHIRRYGEEVLDTLYLNLSLDFYKVFPPIEMLVNLEKLFLFRNQNQLKGFPYQLTELKNLQELEILDNQLNILPPQIGNLINLIELHTNCNQIKNLPREIGNLINLKKLDL